MKTVIRKNNQCFSDTYFSHNTCSDRGQWDAAYIRHWGNKIRWRGTTIWDTLEVRAFCITPHICRTGIMNIEISDAYMRRGEISLQITTNILDICGVQPWWDKGLLLTQKIQYKTRSIVLWHIMSIHTDNKPQLITGAKYLDQTRKVDACKTRHSVIIWK